MVPHVLELIIFHLSPPQSTSGLIFIFCACFRRNLFIPGNILYSSLLDTDQILPGGYKDETFLSLTPHPLPPTIPPKNRKTESVQVASLVGLTVV